MDTQTSMQLNSFELGVADIADADIASLHALSLSVGWPHRPSDWQAVLALGRGIIARDPIGRVLGSAMWFEHDLQLSTIGMVITSPRLQALGAGRIMMDLALGEIGNRRIGLNATRQARRLYASLGFAKEAVVYQCQGEAVMPPPSMLPVKGEVVTLAPHHRPALDALDTLAFGAARPRTLDKLLETATGTALIRDGEMRAYALCRPFGRGHLIGPVVAASDSDAIPVMRPHVARHAGEFLRIDTRQKEGDFAHMLTACGMPVYDTVTSMSLNGGWQSLRPDEGFPLVYGLATQALS
ncbi:GNAT family N-acetyltransferase [Rhizobium sp. FY34]|uniref:GNAT family N-acetyltransferase n=1 Tax=Rhizobium sp. FY34 TaxID=2562309 RepID=UPI0010C0BB56|nr:GNAT family N-acetyltransferase [Rhizobium sp. FY34]